MRQVLVIDLPLPKCIWTEVDDDSVAGCDELPEDVPAALMMQVDRDALLIAIGDLTGDRLASLVGGYRREGSPSPGCSTLITLAPKSPNKAADNGPAKIVDASRTRSPTSGP